MQHIKFRSIERFAHIVEHINKRYVPKPTLTFEGTVKLHGTNIGICYNNRDGLWVQSRSQILSEHNDNAGSYKFVMERKEEFKNEIIEDAAYRKINLDENTITYYGEFCGKGIQKNVGISQIEKSIFLFATKISKIDDSEQGIYITPIISPFFCIKNVYNIKTFGTSEVSIDFNDARHDSDSLRFVVSEAERVENECPVAKGLGFPNTLGEGMVWSCFHNDEWIVFKVKGEKHQQKISRVKEKSAKQTIGEILAEQFCVMPRLDQVYTEVFDVLNGGKGDINRLGDFIKAVVKDVEKEEYLEIEKMGVTIKDVSKPISKIAKIYFLDRLKNEYFDRLKNE